MKISAAVLSVTLSCWAASTAHSFIGGQQQQVTSFHTNNGIRKPKQGDNRDVAAFLLQQPSRGGGGSAFGSRLSATDDDAGKNEEAEDDDEDNALKLMYEPKTQSRLDQYYKEHAYSTKYPQQFWAEQGNTLIDWKTPFDPDKVVSGSFDEGDIAWFEGGTLNLCENAIDRHVNSDRANDVAMIWEGDEPSDVRTFTYKELLHKVSQITNALQSQGVQKGDVVTIYMPMIPELAMTMLACARMGAIHSVVFAGFSSEALANRIFSASSEYVITADIGKRGGKAIQLKDIVDDAIDNKLPPLIGDEAESKLAKKVLVWEHGYHQKSAEHNESEDTADDQPSSATFEMKSRDIQMDPLVESQRPINIPVAMDAEDPLFILYTSGSTGMPKGLVHTTGGYAVFAAFTTKTTFDLSKDDIFACVADCGWITGHTYVVYGPLLNGGTTFLFESTPVYPNPGRYWDMVQRHKITQFYTAPTAIRLLMRYGDSHVKGYDLSSLKILGSVGEPINPEAWKWYYQVVGNKECTIVDTYWQTETGGHIITNIPGVTPMKPGSCTLPMYGIDAVVLDPNTGAIIEAKEGENSVGVLALRQPWPGIARTCLGDHERYKTVYMKAYPGYYFTGDSVLRDKDGYHFITGRVDDVINVSGHRIGTAEIESALVSHPAVAQAAVVGKPHPIKGQGIAAFVMLDIQYCNDYNIECDIDAEATLIKELKGQVRNDIGPFAGVDTMIISDNLPMTRSGKIMRRILRKIVCDEIDTLGDISTLADPSVVQMLIEKIDDTKKK